MLVEDVFPPLNASSESPEGVQFIAGGFTGCATGDVLEKARVAGAFETPLLNNSSIHTVAVPMGGGRSVQKSWPVAGHYTYSK